MNRLGDYLVHPGAAAFPLLVGEEFAELVEDVLQQGLSHPIVLTADGSTIVDGRNRYRACLEAMVDPRFDTLPASFTEDQILDFIVSENIQRRHLNAGQRAMVALELEPMYAAAARASKAGAISAAMAGNANAAKQIPADLRESESQPKPPVSQIITPDELADLNVPKPDRKAREATAQAAKATGASPRAVQQAKAVNRDAPDLADKVRDGEIALDAADRERKKRNATRPKPEPSPTPAAQPLTLTLRTHTGEEVTYPKPKAKAQFNETKGEGISWAAWSWNPVTGCLHGCDYCYARDIATTDRFKSAYPVGFTPLFHHERLTAPANTTIPAAQRDNPAYKRVFVCSMADLYGQWVPQDWIEQVHDAMCATPEWQYITLTKFPSRYVGLDMPPGAWIGTSVDEQKRVRIAENAFRKIEGAAVKWLSLEPLREPLEFTDLSMFDWVVIGAQTETRQPGKGIVPAFAPPFEWVARIVAQAREAGCRIHLKPNLIGATGPSAPGMELPNEYPTKLRIAKEVAS